MADEDVRSELFSFALWHYCPLATEFGLQVEYFLPFVDPFVDP